MTIQYESIYPTFSSLSPLEQLELIRDIRRRRRSFTTPKKEGKKAAKKHSTKKKNQDKLQSLLSNMSPEERAALMEEL